MPSNTTITFLEASNNQRLTKYFGLNETRTYPYVKNVTSHEETIEKSNAGLVHLEAHIRKHAAAGHCLLKGNLKRPLVDESRAGLTDRASPTDLLIIDLDGIQIPGTHLPRMFDKKEITKLTNQFIQLLPKQLWDVSYIVQASSSMGMKGNLCSLHIYMLLDVPIPVKAIKLWFKHVNLNTSDIASQITLSANGQSLKWPLDLSIADSTHICFIASPEFEDKQLDPFINPSDRTVLVKKKKGTIDLVPLAAGLNPEIISEEEISVKNKLRSAAGLKKRASVITTISSNHQPYELLDNPDRMNITVYNDQNYPFVHCDVNGGDSHAYYFFADNPMYMYNFKGEPIWEIQKADPDFYMHITDIVSQKKGQRALVPVAFRDFNTDVYYNGLYDGNLEQFDHSFPLTPTKQTSIEGFFKTQGYPKPDFISDANVVFDPEHKGNNVNLKAKPMAFVNMYQKTRYMFQAVPPKKPLNYVTAHSLKDICPNIYKIIFHMLGNGDQELQHFVNWLACIYQNKRKTETSWTLSGVQGTGKGVFANQILRPLFGYEHAVMKTLENIEEQFNIYMRTALFLVVDEFRIADSRGPIRMADKLKNSITEPYITIRGMRANQRDEPSYVNYLFFTNRHDSMDIEPGDRRYNIAPRQETPLRKAHPEVVKTLETKGLEKELYKFAGALETFEVMNSQIRVPLQNVAKEQLRSVTMSVFEDFCESLKEGKIAAFTDILDISLANTMMAGDITSTQRSIKFWMSEAYKKIDYTIVPVEQLRTLYHIVTEQTPRLSQKQFLKNLERNGFNKVRKRPAGDPKGNAGTGIEISWSFANDAEANELVENYFEEKDLGLVKAQ